METVTARCPHCNATLAEGTPWCSLCFADLRAPEPEPEVTVAAQGEGPAYAPSADGSTEGTERPSAEEVEAVASRMLAELAAAQPNGGVRLPPALQTSGGRAAVMGAGALLVTVVAFGLLALVGALV